MPLVPDSEDDFSVLSAELLDQYRSWLTGRRNIDIDEVVANAGMFLDWRFQYSTGVLDTYDAGDIADFLLGWCPRKLSAPPEASDGICRAVGGFIEFLADTGRLEGGFGRAAGLMTYAEDLIPQMCTAMGDPANFGMAKSLFADLGQYEALTEDELIAAAQARVDEHNELPFEQRKALTDRFFEPEPIVLPFVYVPPAPDELAAAAAAAPLPDKIEALRRYLGAGKALTQKGNLKLADGRALVELLDTGDQFDPQHGGTTFKTTSTEHLPGLNFLLDLAEIVGAVRVHRRRLVPVQQWGGRSPVDRAVELAEIVVEHGPLTLRGSRYRTMLDALHELLDDGIVHWLVSLLGYGTAIEFDHIVDAALQVVDAQFGGEERWAELVDTITRQDVSCIFATLEAAGILTWTGKVDIPTQFGDSYSGAGVVELTALGRYVIAELAPDAGYRLNTVSDLAAGDGAAVIAALDSVPDDQHPAVWAAWQPGRSPAERVALIGAALADANSARMRLTGFTALEQFDRDTVEPVARELLGSSAAGHAALWLMSHGLADDKTAGGFVNIGVLVDVLAATLDEPDEMCRLFTGSLEADELTGMLDDMWRHPAAETGAVLDALGRHLPDAKLAKAARKAAMQHRSWMANQR